MARFPLGLLAQYDDPEWQINPNARGLLSPAPQMVVNEQGGMPAPYSQTTGFSTDAPNSGQPQFPQEGPTPPVRPMGGGRSFTGPQHGQVAGQIDSPARGLLDPANDQQPGQPMQLQGAMQAQPQQMQQQPQQPSGPGAFDKLGTVLGGLYGAGGPGDGLINIGLALASPGNKAQNLQRALAMQGQQQLQRAQLAAQQLKQAQAQMAMKGNVESLRKAFPGYSDEALFGMAQNPALVQDAVKRLNPNETFRTLTDPAERAHYGIPATDMKPYQVDQTGKLSAIGANATTVNIDQKAASEFEKEAGKKQAERFNGYIAGADKAQSMLGDISTMRDISRRVGSQGSNADLKRALGPYAEAFGVNLDGLSDIQAFESIVQRMAPQMRAVGSGSTSDIEFKGFLSALPRLSSNPQAREAIMDTMEATQNYAIQQGDIATKVFNGELTRQEGEKQLRALGNPMQAFREFKKANPDLFTGAASTASPSQAQASPPPAGMPQGARKAPDGNYYVPDPSRPGKYLKVQ